MGRGKAQPGIAAGREAAEKPEGERQPEVEEKPAKRRGRPPKRADPAPKGWAYCHGG